MAVRGVIHAVQDHEVFVVLVEEGLVCPCGIGGVLHFARASNGGADVSCEVMVHRIGVIGAFGAFGVTEACDVPAAAGVDGDPEGAFVRRCCGVGGERKTSCGHTKPSRGCNLEEISSIHVLGSYS